MKKLTKKSDAERVFDAVDKMFLKAEKDHIARAKHAARKGWYAQAGSMVTFGGSGGACTGHQRLPSHAIVGPL